MNQLEICLAYQLDSDVGSIELAQEWSNVLDCHLKIFTNQAPLDTEGILLKSKSLVSHNLNLSPDIDKYLDSTTNLKHWSPWGAKSGPNFQFFQILNYYRTNQATNWLLFLEADTFCTSKTAKSHVNRLLKEFSQAWVIGALPHALARKHLFPNFWDHINGACLLHVGDPDFHDFLARVWIPSVIYRIRSIPYYAYDCVTATKELLLLPEFLRDKWINAATRFIRTPTMLNVSNLSLSLQETQSLVELNSLEFADQTAGSTWFTHAKIREYLRAESQQDRLRIIERLLIQ